ncbi:MAG: hypothetical protein IKV35_07120 [Clostridia bacterium]|nr:hypothetical protein [Clostridia bacterium]
MSESLSKAPINQPPAKGARHAAKKKFPIRMVAMIAAVLLVLGTMGYFQLAANREQTTREQLARQMQVYVREHGETDPQLREQLKDVNQNYEAMVNARNTTGIFGGIAATLLIIVLQVTEYKSLKPARHAAKPINTKDQNLDDE